LLGTQYLRPPDWMYRHHRLYLSVFFLLLTLGITWAVISTLPAVTLAGLAGWILPAAAILALYFGVVLVVQNKKWKRIKQLTPCPDEEAGTISSEAGLIYSADEEDSTSNSGRILLFHDRLIFVTKDGTNTPIIFNAIRHIRIHRIWLIVPVGLEITDSSGHSLLLLVEMPYFWRNRIMAK
jgi:hypothetical protein